MPEVKPKTVPPAGVDTVDITIEETYSVEGVGEDTVTLKGTLVADRGAPLIDRKAGKVEWKTSTVVANFKSLEASGDSDVFGPVEVKLSDEIPSFGVVKNGKCEAALAVVVSMPKQDLTVQSEQPVQLRSDVTTVPPIGDERTESIGPVNLVDPSSGRGVGKIENARVMWRELTEQVEHRINGGGR